MQNTSIQNLSEQTDYGIIALGGTVGVVDMMENEEQEHDTQKCLPGMKTWAQR